MLDDAEESIKVIVVGDGNVGKTCMLRRFVKGDFLEAYRKTIGAEFMEKDVFLRSNNTTVKLMLWDTAGQEVFNALTQAYYRGAGAAILAFSTVDRDSFMNTAGWKQRVESVCGPITMVLCQTKFDLSYEAVITNEEAERLASQLELPLFRVSTRDDFNVTQMFEFTAQRCLENVLVERSDAEERLASSLPREGEEPTAASVVRNSGGVEIEGRHEPSHLANAKASASPPIPADAPLPGGDAREPLSGAAAAERKQEKVREKEKSSRARKKVTLTETAVPGRSKKKRFKCTLY